MKKRQVLINAIMSVVQVVTVGITLFALYRFLLKTIGIEMLGVWSVVLATTSIGNIANLGFSSSVVKFTSKYNAKGDTDTVARLIETSATSLAVLAGLLLLLFYPLAKWLLGLTVPPKELGTALMFLPYALTSLWFTLIAGVFQGGLDGYQRTDLRSILLITGSLTNLALCIIMVRRFGLPGLAYAQVMNSFVVLILSWFMLKKCATLLSWFPYRFDRGIYREMVGYGSRLQVMFILIMLFDPVTKALITKFGGLAMIGYYDMANRMIAQFRSLIISANQVLVPTIADLHETNPALIENIYRDSYRILVYFALPLFSTIIAAAPLISELWIGQYEQMFVFFTVLLSIGWFFNVLTVPAYFVNMGTGELRWNVLSHFITGILNLTLGFILGRLYGGAAVVAVSVLSLITGNYFLTIAYHRKYEIPLSQLLPKENAWLAVMALAGLSGAMIFYYIMRHDLSFLSVLCSVVLIHAVMIVGPFWNHPLRSRLTLWMNRYVLGVKEIV